MFSWSRISIEATAISYTLTQPVTLPRKSTYQLSMVIPITVTLYKKNEQYKLDPTTQPYLPIPINNTITLNKEFDIKETGKSELLNDLMFLLSNMVNEKVYIQIEEDTKSAIANVYKLLY